VDLESTAKCFRLPLYTTPPSIMIPKLVNTIQNCAAAALKQFPGEPKPFLVRIRLYHGWRHDLPSGRLTELRAKFDQLIVTREFPRTIRPVTFQGELEYGDIPLADEERRPIWHTYRDGKQKMVDTAIATDVVYGFTRGNFDVAVILGDDDDLLPPVITAAAAGFPIMLLRSAETTTDKITDRRLDQIVFRTLETWS
jgi:hypothetical protein